MAARKTRKRTVRSTTSRKKTTTNSSTTTSNESSSVVVTSSMNTVTTTSEGTITNTHSTNTGTTETMDWQREYNEQVVLKCAALEKRTEELVASIRAEYEARLAMMPVQVRQMAVRVFYEEHQCNIPQYLAQLNSTSSSDIKKSDIVQPSTPDTSRKAKDTTSSTTTTSTTNTDCEDDKKVVKQTSTRPVTRSMRPSRIPRSARKRTINTRSRTAQSAMNAPPPPPLAFNATTTAATTTTTTTTTTATSVTAQMATPKLSSRLPKTPLMTSRAMNKANSRKTALTTPVAQTKSKHTSKRLTLRREPSLVPITSPETVITLPLGKDQVLELDPAISPSNVRNLGDAERQQVKDRLARMQSQLARLMQNMD
ncbi:hypothetical protein BDF22DRAFT_679390 [Syncephalis plumigaleata]|nr:hypothetical protein BDF22DRAFT_679390 [Syncephalis plumigaleata]